MIRRTKASSKNLITEARIFARFASSIAYVISESGARAMAITLMLGNCSSSGFAPDFAISIEKFNIEVSLFLLSNTS